MAVCDILFLVIAMVAQSVIARDNYVKFTLHSIRILDIENIGQER